MTIKNEGSVKGSMTIKDFLLKKQTKQKISMITCYDYWSASIINDSLIDMILVGDSLAMVMHGFSTTIPATMDLMVSHTAAVVRGAPNKFIVGDMPFLSVRKSLGENTLAVEKIMQAGAHAIKLEGAHGNLEFIEHIVQSGVPVIGHLGLTPQSIHMLSGFSVQGREEKAAEIIYEQSLALEQAGCFALVLECVPSLLADKITKALHIPTIGIGAGPATDGQVLVLQDMLGVNKNFSPKFLKKYFNGYECILNALNEYHTEVEDGLFPTLSKSYS